MAVNGVTRTYSYNPSNPEEVASVSAAGQPTVSYGYDAAGDATSIADTGARNEALSYDAQQRLVGITLGRPITSTVAIDYNAPPRGYPPASRLHRHPAGAGQPSRAESFQYRDDQLGQVAYSGTLDNYLLPMEYGCMGTE